MDRRNIYLCINYDCSDNQGAINELVTTVGTKIAKTTNVTAINDTDIADGEIAVFNLSNKDIRTSDKTIVTTLGSDDTTVPTSKAVKDVTDLSELASNKTTVLSVSNDTLYPTTKAVNDGLDEIKRVVGMGFEINSWEAVQQIVRDGEADKYFKVGDQFLAEYNGTEYALDVIGINQDTPTDTELTNSLTLQFHDCLFNGQFSAPQALYLVKDTELVAGDYYFEYLSVNYQFTLSCTHWRSTFPWAYSTDILTTKIFSWATRISTPAIESVSISVGGTGTKINSGQRYKPLQIRVEQLYKQCYQAIPK